MPGRREDFTVHDVIRLWLEEGESVLAISLQYGVSTGTVQRRLREARQWYPDLLWEERAQRTSHASRSSNREYVSLNDGKPGASETRGSIVQTRGNRNRSR